MFTHSPGWGNSPSTPRASQDPVTPKFVTTNPAKPNVILTTATPGETPPETSTVGTNSNAYYNSTTGDFSQSDTLQLPSRPRRRLSLSSNKPFALDTTIAKISGPKSASALTSPHDHFNVGLGLNRDLSRNFNSDLNQVLPNSFKTINSGGSSSSPTVELQNTGDKSVLLSARMSDAIDRTGDVDLN